MNGTRAEQVGLRRKDHPLVFVADESTEEMINALGKKDPLPSYSEMKHHASGNAIEAVHNFAKEDLSLSRTWLTT
jgi:hypothetical protein